ncbi:MAG: hypothetical protein DMG54_13310 [Acidobacteria bacterium]|nr:MAG: hypothetical protein DMG54_13310 [Acidobacteriota bacterium]PYU46082.1 MAG: hypothetical protein DMG53_12730 [Acidobacteriota bacterium]PYU74831.1 MAG: hypothetical protein DMG52_09645 [Acidobacteriota bacterium]
MRKKKASPKRRSRCPLNACVEILGHPWSLPIIRDMMLRGLRTCKEFLERIATNIFGRSSAEIQSSWNHHHRARWIGGAKADLLAGVRLAAAKVVLGRADDIL